MALPCYARLLASAGALARGGRGSRGIRPTGVLDALLLRLAIQFRMQVVAAHSASLFLHHTHAIRFGVRVLANASDLPGHFQSRLAAGDLESVALDLGRQVHRGVAADAGELIAEFAVERVKPFRQLHPSL